MTRQGIFSFSRCDPDTSGWEREWLMTIPRFYPFLEADSLLAQFC